MTGGRVEEIPAVLDAMEGAVARGRFAKAGLGVAMFDAWVRSSGVPVRSLLGGAVRDSIECNWAPGAMPLEEMVAEIDELLAADRHRSFEVKMGALAPAEDVARIAALAERLNGRAGLRVDINVRWDRFTANVRTWTSRSWH